MDYLLPTILNPRPCPGNFCISISKKSKASVQKRYNRYYEVLNLCCYILQKYITVRTFWTFWNVLHHTKPWIKWNLNKFRTTLVHDVYHQIVVLKLLANLFHNWHIFIFFQKFPLSVARGDKFQKLSQSATFKSILKT